MDQSQISVDTAEQRAVESLVAHDVAYLDDLTSSVLSLMTEDGRALLRALISTPEGRACVEGIYSTHDRWRAAFVLAAETFSEVVQCLRDELGSLEAGAGHAIH